MVLTDSNSKFQKHGKTDRSNSLTGYEYKDTMFRALDIHFVLTRIVVAGFGRGAE